MDKATISVKNGAYSSITIKKTIVNAVSITNVNADPVKKFRIFSNSRTRATVSPTRLDPKYAKGNASKCLNNCAPSSTSIRFVVCEKIYVRKVLKIHSNTVMQINVKKITSKVLKL